MLRMQRSITNGGFNGDEMGTGKMCRVLRHSSRPALADLAGVETVQQICLYLTMLMARKLLLSP